ncbi:MAG: hypothetical protein ABUT39_25965 [Acidobacteriota bacterium]
MRTKRSTNWMLLFLVGLLFGLSRPESILAQQQVGKTRETSSATPRPKVRIAAPAPGAPIACQKRVGILGNYFGPEMQAFLVANGLTVTFETAGSIGSGSLNNLDVLYLNRGGVADATAQKAAIEAWVRNGGVLITEFDATELLFNSTFTLFPPATLDNNWAVPSGSVCGGNTVNVTNSANALATGLPPSWSCSGDPLGVFKVYNENTLPANLDRVARLSVDQNKDGAKDLVVGTACMDNGAVVPFFSDFGDWQALQNPRTCPNPPCSRSIEDETLMLNAVCRVKDSCKPLDHFLCYKIKPRKEFPTRTVLVHDQFGDHTLIVLTPDTLCVPATKRELQ